MKITSVVIKEEPPTDEIEIACTTHMEDSTMVISQVKIVEIEGVAKREDQVLVQVDQGDKKQSQLR